MSLYSPFARSQASAHSRHSRVGEFKLRIIPDKETYSLTDKLSTTKEFTNLTRETLCFPEPAEEVEEPAQGYLITKTIGPDGAAEDEQFIEHYSGGGTWPQDKLVKEIREQWIWLAPNAIYLTVPRVNIAKLETPGQRRLEATYRPPEGSYRPVEFRDYLETAARIAGCTVPHKVVSAKQVVVNVSPQCSGSLSKNRDNTHRP